MIIYWILNYHTPFNSKVMKFKVRHIKYFRFKSMTHNVKYNNITQWSKYKNDFFCLIFWMDFDILKI